MPFLSSCGNFCLLYFQPLRYTSVRRVQESSGLFCADDLVLHTSGTVLCFCKLPLRLYNTQHVYCSELVIIIMLQSQL